MIYSLSTNYEKHQAGIANDQHAVTFVEPTDNPRVFKFVKTCTEAGLEILSRRARLCLEKEGIKTLEQVDGKRVSDMLKIPNLGKKTVEEIQEALRPLNLSLLA